MKKVPSGITPNIEIDPKSEAPLYRQVYEGYRTKIVDGTLRPGQRIPSSRMLATELGISRLPVLNAYAQLLQEGYFESRVGSGTVISRSLPDQAPVLRNLQKVKPRSGPRPLSSRCSVLTDTNLVALRRGWGAFGVGQVEFEHFPFRVWNSLVTRYTRAASAESLDYGNPMGLDSLREAIATYLRTARGARCEAEQIMIVSGSQQALEITTRVLLDPGDSVWMEEPGYRLARFVFTLNGCRVVPVTVDYEGLNVAVGVQRSRKARAALVTPSHQYPLGVVMSASRRLQLLEWAENASAWIIEDDYDSEYRYDSAPVPCLQGLDRNSRVIYIGTFSKVMFPSLRLGYLVIPSDLVDKFLAVRLAADITPPRFFQSVLADFIREGHFSRHIRRMRAIYKERRSILNESIREEFGFGADVTGGEAGMHLTVSLKAIRDREIAETAVRQKLWLAPLSSSYLEQPRQQGFILGFGSTENSEIRPAVRKLAALTQSQ